jgi:prolyl-tRNA synthetase
MRMSRLFAPTLKESPSGVEVISHEYLLRAGMMRQLAAGIYELLPLGWKAVRRIEEIIREEMDRSGAQELRLPAVQPANIWKESGRWDYYGPELLRFEDRRGGEFCLGPTHEEVITTLVRDDVRSYKELPINLYQMQTKFRDELRPRAGLLRGREFIMKDAYSFDVDEEAAKKSYDIMYDAYDRIFRRCGLEFRPVEADTGAIGGNLSHEFQVLADSGEDSIVSCEDCGYTANVEKAELKPEPHADPGEEQDLEKVHTPKMHSAQEVADFLDVPVTRIIKTLVFEADGELVAVLTRGDHDANEVKVKARLGADVLHPASRERIQEELNAPVGFIGPVRLDGIRVFVDETLRGLQDGVSGANEKDYHYKHVSVERDIGDAEFVDVRTAGDGDVCGRCGGTFQHFRGIEVGQVFHLGTKYSEPLGCTFLDSNGKEQPMVMGCYGIGVTRILSAAIEQNHDDDGIIWPMALAPYQVAVLPLQMNRDDVVEEADRIYDELTERGFDVLIDDRDQGVGAKFADSELIGIPLRIAIGSRGLDNDEVEFKPRGASDKQMIATSDIVDHVANLIEEALG